jgi:hypothetical protein
VRAPLYLDLTGQVLGRGRIGVRLATLISYLRTTLRLLLAAIQRYLRGVHQLTLSVGGIQEILHDVAQATAPAVDALKQQARRSRILHGDETSWRENRVNGYSGASVHPVTRRCAIIPTANRGRRRW